MENATMCTYPQSEHALTHWKCVLRCCNDCPCINIPDQETTKNHEKTTPSIRFHIYHIIGRCDIYGRISLKTRTFVPCVNNNLHQINLQKYTPEKNWLWWKQQYLIFIPVSTYQPSKSWPFVYHMCAYLVQITVVKCDAQPSNDVNYFEMFYVAVIMLRG